MNRIFFFLCMLSFLFSIEKSKSQSFTAVSTSISGTIFGSSAWGDYDNDGDLDLIIGGSPSAQAGSIGPGMTLYRNDGNNVFVAVPTAVDGISEGGLAWGDYDNDGDLDLLVTGEHTDIYRNDGGATFTNIHAGITDAHLSAVAWGDYDNDGYLDFVVIGYLPTPEYITKIYHNNHDGTFTDINASFVTPTSSYGVGSVTWGDSDNDGDLDLLIAAATSHDNHTVLYINHGNGNFTNSGATFEGVYQSAVKFGDYDNDGDLDVLLTGRAPSAFHALIYRNDGNNVFVDIHAGMTGVEESAAGWGDYDNDGDLDAMICGGNENANTRVTKIYRNNGNDVFSEDVILNLSGISAGTAIWGDTDNDGDLDLFISGSSNTYAPTSILYRNDISTPNHVPATPYGLSAVVTDRSVVFNWNKAIDAETDQPGLSYNFYIGTTASNVALLSPMANKSNGYRKIVDIGNAGQSTTWKINNIPDGHYFWCVQSIDAGFGGSPFCINADTFSVHPIPVVPCSYKDLFIPNLVTRNKDGMNDYFEIKGTACSGIKLNVYNNWGAEVFHSDHYQSNWDGDGLEDGVYYYELEAGDGTNKYKGWVELIH